MSFKLMNNMLQLSEVAGLELLLNSDGSFIVNVALVKLEKLAVTKKAEYLDVKSIKDLKNSLSRELPIAVVISGKGVLIKSITERENITNYVAEFFPQGNPNEFYHNFTKQGDKLFIAIARKELIDGLIQALLQNGYKVLSLSLGFLDIELLLPYITHSSMGQIETALYKVYYNEQFQLTSFDTKPKETPDLFSQQEYAIGEQYFRPVALLPFAAASSLIAKTILHPPRVESDLISGQRKEFIQSKYFSIASWATLIGFFLALLANFILYNYYSSKNNEFSKLQTISEEQITQLKKQETVTKRKENFLTQTGWIKNSKTSYFADRIASLVSADIYLTALHLFPNNTASYGINKDMPFKKDTIQIAGVCTVPLELNQFTNNMKNLAEIKEVTVKNYLYKKENDNATFLIEVIIK